MKAYLALCSQCPLLEEPFVPSWGSIDAPVIIVGEAPGVQEALRSEPFVGDSGRLLNAAVSQAGHSRDDLYLTNVVLCRPPQNREPTQDEISCCLPRLKAELDAHHADRILLLGKTAANTILGLDRAGLRGQWATFMGKDVLSTWHPAYVLRKPSEAQAFLADVTRSFKGPLITAARSAPTYTVVTTLPELARELSQAPERIPCSYDLETNQINWYDRLEGERANSILLAVLAWTSEHAIIIGDELLYDEPGTASLLEDFFARMLPCGHNAKFDNTFLRSHLGCNIQTEFDTLLAHYVLNENEKHGLKLLASEELGIPDYEKELITQYLNSRNDEYSKIPFDKLAQYASWDAVATLELRRIYHERLEKEGLLDWPFHNVIMPLQEALTQMTMIGIQVDIPYLHQAGEQLTAEMARVQRELGELVDHPDINLNSPPQVSRVLFQELRLPQKIDNRHKEGSTAEGAIGHLKGRHPFVDGLIYYRSISKLKSSYIDNMIEYADVEGRVHPDGLVWGTEIGRISMRNPAAQTIPRSGDQRAKDYSPYTDGAMIRGAVIAPPGKKLVICDYSQAELRVFAVLAHEQFLLEAYRNGRDLHSEVAIAMYGPDYTKEQRVMCKMFNFSYIYGGSEYSFAQDSGLAIDVARNFVKQYNILMPSGLAYKKAQYQLMLDQGYVSTLFNRRRRFPLITQENKEDARKSAVHAPVAGTASDLTSASAIQLLGEGFRVILLVHDSILVECDERIALETATYVAHVMKSTGERYLPEVPWKVDAEIQDRWAEPPSW